MHQQVPLGQPEVPLGEPRLAGPSQPSAFTAVPVEEPRFLYSTRRGVTCHRPIRCASSALPSDWLLTGCPKRLDVEPIRLRDIPPQTHDFRDAAHPAFAHQLQHHVDGVGDLVTDGRIHPARIEEIVAKTKKQIEEEIVEIGERTVIDLGINGLHPELIRMVGRMRYRSSYGQNLLQHSREVANFCATMAAELGLNVKLAKRAGLLHDIGKVPDDNPELPHAILGMQLAEKYKEHPEVCNAIGAHHDEIEMTSMLSPIIQVCDAISGARPGARREVVESYIKRLKELEELAMSYPGVEKTFAIQAGRELRVVVESEKISDAQSEILAADISNRIQTEMTYPGQIKVTVIRETRSVAFAK